jgi:arylsulfatase A-like enzyme
MDWFPTLAELAGVEIPEGHHIDGKSITAVIKEDAKSPHEDMYWRLGANPSKAKWVVRQGDWKLLGNAAENVRPEGTSELSAKGKELFLVNLKEDIGERVNLRDKNPDKLKALLKIRESYEASLATGK